jgi:hypothetical protein
VQAVNETTCLNVTLLLADDFSDVDIPLFIDVDECANNPCANGGICSNFLCGFECDCGPYYIDALCETPNDPCEDHACIHDSACVAVTPIEYRCECTSGFFGEYCETDIDECTSPVCGEGELCINTYGGHRCECPANHFPSYVCYSTCGPTSCPLDSLCISDGQTFYCHHQFAQVFMVDRQPPQTVLVATAVAATPDLTVCTAVYDTFGLIYDRCMMLRIQSSATLLLRRTMSSFHLQVSTLKFDFH